MINLTTQQVWYADTLWDVVQVFSPNKFDNFLLLKVETGEVNEDSSHAVDMILLDCLNDEFYPATEEVNEMLGARGLRMFAEDEIQEEEDEVLQNIWLATVGDTT